MQLSYNSIGESFYEVLSKEDFISLWNSYISSHQGKTEIKRNKYAVKLNATIIKRNIWHIESEFPTLSQEQQERHKSYKTLKLTSHVPFLSTGDISIRKKKGMDGLTLKTYRKLEELNHGYACIAAKPHTYKLHYLIQLLKKPIAESTFKRLAYNAKTGTMVVDFRCSYLAPEYLNNIISLLDL